MQNLTGEFPGMLRNIGLAVMAGADDQMIEDFLPASRQRHRPAAVGSTLRALDARPQADERLEAEMGGIAVEIRTQLPVGGKVRVIRRHRIVLELGQALRGDDVRGKIHAGPIPFFAKHPITADCVALVIADDAAEPGRQQIFERREAAGSRADHANARLQPIIGSKGGRVHG